MSNIKLETKTYDVILLGTGLVQSIVASACARAGKTVLHIDRNEFYGGRNATFNLGEFQKWLQSENDVEGSTHDPEHAESNLAAWKEIAEDIDDKYVYLPISERCQDFECFDQKSELQKDDFNEEKRDECDSNSPSEEKSPHNQRRPPHNQRRPPHYQRQPHHIQRQPPHNQRRLPHNLKFSQLRNFSTNFSIRNVAWKSICLQICYFLEGSWSN
eukprot:365886_1